MEPHYRPRQQASASSSESKELDHDSYVPTRLSLRGMLKNESRLDGTMQQSRNNLEAEVYAADDDGLSALCRRADKERREGQLFKAIDTYIQVIRTQLKSNQLRKSSPSRRALSRILVYVFLETDSPISGGGRWWSSDALKIKHTLANSILKMPLWPLSLGAVDALQTLADYIVKWYAPEALDCAALLYERILSHIDGEPSSFYDNRRSHVVKELAKIYVEKLSTPGESTDTISSAKHAIIRQGRREIEKCSIHERVRFSQHLGALYVHNTGKDPRCSSREGEEMLRHIHGMQVQLYGRADCRSIKTVGILSQYYVEQGGRDIEAAQLIENALKTIDQHPLSYGDSEYEKGDEDENKGTWNCKEYEKGEKDRNMGYWSYKEDKDKRYWSSEEDEKGEGARNRGYWSDEDSVTAPGMDDGEEGTESEDDVDDGSEDEEKDDMDDDDDVENAGDERKRREIEEREKSVVLKGTRVTSQDYEFQSILHSGTLQARLMSLLAPPMCVWQDSRLYLSDIAAIQFRRVAITDTLENYPVRVTRLRSGEVDVEVSIVAHARSMNEKIMRGRISEVIRSVQESNFYRLLRSGAAAHHFAKRPETTPEPELRNNANRRTDSGVKDETGDLQPNLATSDTDHVFWAFPRDLNAATGEKQVHEVKF